MTLQQALIWANKKFLKAKITSPGLDSEVLLSHALKKSKEYLYTYPKKKLTKKQLVKFKKFISRRAKHEPVAYLVKRKEFFGLNFYVDKNVLIPRPETELLVEEVLKIIPKKLRSYKPQAIVDVGTGSGCVAITLAKHLPEAKIYATDISKKVLRVAKKNTKLHNVSNRITFLQGNLLKPLLNNNFIIPNSKFLILANLPYLTTKQWQQASPDIKLYEPRQALDAGPDGLKYFRQLFQQIQLLVTDYGLRVTVILETDPRQIKPLKEHKSPFTSPFKKGGLRGIFPKSKTCPESGRRIQIKNDLAGLGRCIIIKTKNQLRSH